MEALLGQVNQAIATPKQPRFIPELACRINSCREALFKLGVFQTEKLDQLIGGQPCTETTDKPIETTKYGGELLELELAIVQLEIVTRSLERDSQRFHIS